VHLSTALHEIYNMAQGGSGKNPHSWWQLRFYEWRRHHLWQLTNAASLWQPWLSTNVFSHVATGIL